MGIATPNILSNPILKMASIDYGVVTSFAFVMLAEMENVCVNLELKKVKKLCKVCECCKVCGVWASDGSCDCDVEVEE